MDLQNKKISVPFTAGKAPSARCGHAMSSTRYDKKAHYSSIMIIGGNNETLCAMDVGRRVTGRSTTCGSWT